MIALLPALFLLTGCKMEEYTDEEAGEEFAASVPVGHGEGTQQRPFTPDEMMAGGDLPYGEEVWVMGYAVGSTIQNMENATFEVPTTNAHNILISSDSLCTDAERCIPVEFSGSNMQLRFSLAHQPGSLHRFIVIRGTLGLYFSHVGIRQSDAAYWIDGFDLSRIAPPRQDWDIVDKEF